MNSMSVPITVIIVDSRSRGPNPTCYVDDVELTDTVKQLREKIAKQLAKETLEKLYPNKPPYFWESEVKHLFNIPFTNPLSIHNSIGLEDNRLLSFYGINHESRINVSYPIAGARKDQADAKPKQYNRIARLSNKADRNLIESNTIGILFKNEKELSIYFYNEKKELIELSTSCDQLSKWGIRKSNLPNCGQSKYTDSPTHQELMDNLLKAIGKLLRQQEEKLKLKNFCEQLIHYPEEKCALIPEEYEILKQINCLDVPLCQQIIMLDEEPQKNSTLAPGVIAMLLKNQELFAYWSWPNTQQLEKKGLGQWDLAAMCIIPLLPEKNKMSENPRLINRITSAYNYHYEEYVKTILLNYANKNPGKALAYYLKKEGFIRHNEVYQDTNSFDDYYKNIKIKYFSSSLLQSCSPVSDDFITFCHRLTNDFIDRGIPDNEYNELCFSLKECINHNFQNPEATKELKGKLISAIRRYPNSRLALIYRSHPHISLDDNEVMETPIEVVKSSDFQMQQLFITNDNRLSEMEIRLENNKNEHNNNQVKVHNLSNQNQLLKVDMAENNQVQPNKEKNSLDTIAKQPLSFFAQPQSSDSKIPTLLITQPNEIVEVPEHFFCPVNQQPMKEPVQICRYNEHFKTLEPLDKYSYEKDIIESWIQKTAENQRPKCPISRNEIPYGYHLVINNELKNAIDIFYAEHSVGIEPRYESFDKVELKLNK